MKKNLLSVFAFATSVVAFSSLSSCDFGSALDLEFDIPQEIETIYRIDPQTGLTITSVDTITVNLDSLLATKDASRDDIESITTSSVSFTITDENGVVIPTSNFSNVKSTEVTVENVGNGIALIATFDSVEMAAFGTNNPIVSDVTSTSFGVDFLGYFLDGTFTIEETLNFYEPITEPVFVKTQITVLVTVKL